MGWLCIKLYETGKGSPPQKASDATNHVFEADRKAGRDYRPYLEGKDVNRYCIEYADRWLRYGPNLAAPREPALFEGRRLLFRRIVGDRLIGTFVEGDFVTSQLLQIVKPNDGQKAKSLLAILNSTLTAYYFKKKYNRQDKTFPEIRIYELASLPIPKRIPEKAAHDLDILVDQILDAKRADAGANTSALEAEIDRHVYALYGLTSEEIKIVEGTAREIPALAFQPTAKTEHWRDTPLKRPLHARQPLGDRYQPALVVELLAQAGLPVSFEVFRRAYWFLTQPDRLATWVKGALPQHGAQEWRSGFTESLPAGTFFAHLKAMIQQGQIKLRTLDGEVCFVEVVSQPAGIAHVVCDARLAILAAESPPATIVVPALSVAEKKELTGLISVL